MARFKSCLYVYPIFVGKSTINGHVQSINCVSLPEGKHDYSRTGCRTVGWVINCREKWAWFHDPTGGQAVGNIIFINHNRVMSNSSGPNKLSLIGGFNPSEKY